MQPDAIRLVRTGGVMESRPAHRLTSEHWVRPQSIRVDVRVRATVYANAATIERPFEADPEIRVLTALRFRDLRSLMDLWSGMAERWQSEDVTEEEHPWS